VPGGGANSVGGIAVAAHAIAAAEVTLCIHVTDVGLDGGAVGAVGNVVGIRCGAIFGNMKVPFQAARSIG
jgi:hypothetical protein